MQLSRWIPNATPVEKFRGWVECIAHTLAGCLGFPSWIWKKQRLCSWLIIRSRAIRIHSVDSRKWRKLVRNGECAIERAQETHFHLLSNSCAGSDGKWWTKVKRRLWGCASSRGSTASDHFKELGKLIFLPFPYHYTYSRGGEGMH